VKITSIEAQGFLSLRDIQIAPIDDRLTVIVGPNAAGKSSVIRLLDLLVHLLAFSAGDQAAYGRLAVHRGAGATGGTGSYEARVGIELDQPSERQLLTQFVRAAAISTAIADSRNQQERRDPATIDAQISATATEELLAPLFAGRLVLGFSPQPTDTWSLAYEFTVNGAMFTYSLRSQDMISAGPWHHGKVETNAIRQLGWRLWPGVDEADPQREKPFVFTLDALLPGADGVANLRTESLHAQTLTPSLQDFAVLVGADLQRGMTYNGGAIFHQIAGRALTIVHENRRPPRREYRSDEIGQQGGGADLEALPRELQRLKNGDAPDRTRFEAIQQRFADLTGRAIDVTTTRIDRSDPWAATVSDDAEVIIEPQIREQQNEFPLEFAGAGAWEAAIIASSTVVGAGEVVVLDEPARNLHPTLQRRVLRHLLDSQAQSIITTHSAFLVPAQAADDLYRVVRIDRQNGNSVVHRLGAEAEGATVERYRQLFAAADVRALLFAAGVVLVEGETDAALLSRWFASAAEESNREPDALNVIIEPVGGDSRFGPYRRLLSAFGIRSVVISDGPVLSPDYAHSLANQIDLDGTALPASGDFDAWREFWATHGVFTAVASFDEEIEGYLHRLDADAAKDAERLFPKSKARQGTYFAENVPCPPEIAALYDAVLAWLELSSARRRALG
jgi:ABC-type ATPase involved in cell division